MASKESSTLFGRVEDALTRAHYTVMKPLFYALGQEIALTKNTEERTKLMTMLLIETREKGEIRDIRFAAGGDDGDLDQFADALLFSGAGLGDDVVKWVRVTSTPVGSAPESIRNAWQGVEFIGIKLPAVSEAERDLMTGETTPERGTFAVYAPYALKKLKQSSPKAAKWFTKNLPKNTNMLSFGVDEVELIPRPQQ